MNHEELVKALRCCATMTCKGDECKYMILGCHDCFPKLHNEAADAIEALNRLLDQNTQRCEALRKQLREAHESYERHLNDLEAQLPKQGEWIEENRRPRSSQFVCSECHRTAYDPQPTRDKAWRKRCRYAYCPNCGAKMNDSNASNALNALDNAQDGPIITPCRGCSDYDGYGGCKSKGGCARAKMEVQDAPDAVKPTDTPTDAPTDMPTVPAERSET